MQKIPDKLKNPRGFGDVEDPEPETNENGEEIPTEEEQLNYDLLTVRARKMIFGKGRDKVLKMLGSSEMPAKGLGKAGAMIIKALMESSKQAGREIDGNTAIHAAAEVVDDLNELAKTNKVFQYETPEDEQKAIDDAMLWGVKFYGDGMLQSGEITPQMQQLAKTQIEQGIAEENAGKMKKDPVRDSVSAAMNKPKGGGLVGGEMKGGM